MKIELAGTTEQGTYVYVQVSSRQSGAWKDVASDQVYMAFMLTGKPGPSDWVSGSVETDSSVVPTTYALRCLVGGTGSGADAKLANGDYAIWAKVADSPETPIQRVGRLVVF